MNRARIIINLTSAPLLLATTIIIVYRLFQPQQQSVTETEATTTQVAAMEYHPKTARPAIHTFGNTRSHLTTTLGSQLSGRILYLSPNFEVGNFVSKGEILVEIDPADYQTILVEREADLASARQNLADEQTLFQLAKDDWIASGRKLEDATDLSLRKPQLAAAKARESSAIAAVAKAQLDIARTRIAAPFDAIVATRTTSPGNIVSAGSSLGSLFSRERLEVRVPLTPKQAAQLDLSGRQSFALKAKITTPSILNQSWTAIIKRLEPSVNPKSQTLWAIGEVDSPFTNPKSFLPIGAYVEVAITGKDLTDVYHLPEISVVNDQFVWALDSDNTLYKQPVEIVFHQEQELFARVTSLSFKTPLTIITRPLPSFREGQAIEVISPSIVLK